MNCHNCGVPKGALKGEGREIQIEIKAANGFQRNRKTTVWVCTDECAIQALAISKWGPNSSKWPVTLAQFRATKPLETGTFAANPTRGIRPSKIAKMRLLESKG